MIDEQSAATPVQLARRRWDTYVLASTTAESVGLWQAAHGIAKEAVLVCGVGFDPRTLDVATAMHATLGNRMRVLALELPGEPESPVGERALRHRAEIERIFGARASFLPNVDVSHSSAAGPALTRRLVAEVGLLEEQHVVVDISALPSSISFPLLQLLLTQSKPGAQPAFTGELQVCVSESPNTDARITATGLDEPETLAGFERLPDPQQTRVWVPVLGEGRGEQLRAIREFLQPAEVCPVLPFPARNPRRADDLLLEHQVLLFDVLAFEPRNVLYASEGNPFDLYRQLSDLAGRYTRALEPLGGATVAVSQHASKLLSLGAVLAAHEADLVVVHVRPTGYVLQEGPEREPQSTEPVLHTAWLAGRPYEL